MKRELKISVSVEYLESKLKELNEFSPYTGNDSDYKVYIKNNECDYQTFLERSSSYAIFPYTGKESDYDEFCTGKCSILDFYERSKKREKHLQSLAEIVENISISKSRARNNFTIKNWVKRELEGEQPMYYYAYSVQNGVVNFELPELKYVVTQFCSRPRFAKRDRADLRDYDMFVHIVRNYPASVQTLDLSLLCDDAKAVLRREVNCWVTDAFKCLGNRPIQKKYVEENAKLLLAELWPTKNEKLQSQAEEE